MGSENNIIKKLIIKFPIYDFSNSEYINIRTPISVICPTHGIFTKKPSLMLHNNQGCQKCGFESRTKKSFNTKEELIERFNQIHDNKYDYSLVNYVRNNSNIKIVCPIHGIFEQRPDNHLHSGCKKCGTISMSEKKTYTLGEFIYKSNKIHNNKYSYIDSIYLGAFEYIMINCNIHGEFNQIASYHMNGSGCPKCNLSKGETTILNFLNDNDIIHECQHIFEDCYYINFLRFDFFIPSLNTCIEYDGRHHYVPINAWGGIKEFELIQKKDAIKNQYCKDNGINLIRIPFYEYDFINEILTEDLLNIVINIM